MISSQGIRTRRDSLAFALAFPYDDVDNNVPPNEGPYAQCFLKMGMIMDNEIHGDPFLVRGAKNEGALVWISAWPDDNTDLIAGEFQRRHPFVRVHTLPHPGKNCSAYAFPKLEQEWSTGRYEVDVVGPTTATTVADYADRGFLASHNSATGAQLPPVFRDPNGRWYATHSMGICLAYNKDIVPASRWPKTWNDLLDPYWSGKILMEDGRYSGTIYEWFVGVYRSVGEDWFRQLARQQLSWFRDGAVQHGSQELAAGRCAVVPWQVDYLVQQRIDRGEPLAWANPTRIGRIPAFAISARAPHPNAARLFIDWLLSEDCQRIIGEKNLGMPALPGVPSYMKQFYPPGTTLTINNPSDLMRQKGRWRQLFTEIFFPESGGSV